MKLRTFLFSFVSVYVLISLPAIVGLGYVIDWIPEATLLQKFKGYVVDGLFNNFFTKIVIASIIGMVVSIVISKRRQNSF